MSFEPVHIHKTKRSSFGVLFLLLIPAIVFVAIVAYVAYGEGRGSVSGVSTGSGLTESVK